MSSWMIVGVVTIACISPLLTLATLWQKKEWRIDRLKEHLRSEGYFRQLFGILRPVVIIGTILSAMANLPWNNALGILALALLSVMQFALRRQRFPVWTMKAIALVGSSLIMNILAVIILPVSTLQLLLPLLQCIPLSLAWLAFLPVDFALKQHIMKKASLLRSEFDNATVIGITGSVGKTTTKELVAHILKEKNVLYTPAYVNSEMGVSKWLLKELPNRSREEELIIIVEMGAYKMGEIQKLCSITKPSMGVVTFIGTQHVALFGSQERLCKAKGELLECLPEDGQAFINSDNSLCSKMIERCNCSVTSVGTGGHADLEAFEIEEQGDGIRFRVNQQDFSMHLHGTHNVTNILLAIAVTEKLGIDLPSSAARLQSFEPPHHTFSVRQENGITILDDTHNASPESFRASLAWAKSQPANKKILVTPGLIELGTNEDRIHRELGSASNGIVDRVIFTGKQGRSAFSKGFNGTVELINSDPSKTSEGDLLLFVGRVSQKQIHRLMP